MRLASSRLSVPAIAVVAILLAAMCAMPFIGAATTDTETARREEMLVKRNILLWIADMENALQPFAISDEAIVRLDHSFDADWARQNVANAILSSTPNRFVAILGSEGQVLLKKAADATSNDRILNRRMDTILTEAALLTRVLRIFEASRPAASRAEKLAESKIVMIESMAVLVTATVFQPDTLAALADDKRAPVLITAQPIAGGIVEAFSTRFLLRDALLEWRPTGADSLADLGLAGAEIASNGQSELWLVWLPNQPGNAMLRRVLPLMGGTVLAFILGMVVLFGMSRRMTETLRRSEAQFRHAAAHDVLTGLKNRRAFEDRLEKVAAQTPLTLACFDLDGFKPINDSHGHAAGDTVLRVVASRLESACRAQDEAFRLGGDEFALILPNLFGADARLACRTVAALVAAPIDIGGVEVRVGASVGLATADGFPSVRTVLSRADAALYRAKTARRAEPVVADEAEPRAGASRGAAA